MNLTRARYQLIKESSNMLILTFTDKVQITKEDAVQLDLDCLLLIPDDQFFLIIEARNLNSSMTGEALQYLAKEGKARGKVLACAILLNNLPIRLLAKLYIRYHKPPYTTAIFEKPAKMEEWISEINSHNHNLDQTRN